MKGIRLGAAVLGCVIVVSACSDGGSGDDNRSTPSTAPPATVADLGADGVSDPSDTPTVPAPQGGSAGLSGVVLARALVQQSDLPGYEVRSEVRPFDSRESAGLLICGADLREETGQTDGVQAVFVRDEVQATVTVTAGVDPAGAATFLERFAASVDGCDGPWSQDAARLGDDPIEAEILGLANVGDPGVPTAAVRLRTTGDAGSSDVVIAVLATGPVLSSVTVAGPVDADLGDAAAVVEAAARRASDLVRQLG